MVKPGEWRKPSPPLVSIIVAAYNISGIKSVFRQAIKSCLDSDRVEIIVVDNGSKDDSQSVLSEFGNQIVVKRVPRNLGHAEGTNLGASLAKGEFLLLLDADAIPIRNSIAVSLEKMGEDHRLGAVGGITLGYTKRESTGSGFFFDVFFRGYEAHKNYSLSEFRNTYASMVPTAFLLVRRKALGGRVFPREFHTYTDDSELCFRLWSRGYKMLTLREPLAYHEPGSSRKSAAQTDASLTHQIGRNFLRNDALMLTILRMYLPGHYFLRFITTASRLATDELIHFPIFLMKEDRYRFPQAYHPGESIEYIRHSATNLPTSRLYGPSVPLLLCSRWSDLASQFGRRIQHEELRVTRKDLDSCQTEYLVRVDRPREVA